MILLLIGLLFECSLVFRAVYTTEPVITMLTKNVFKKVGGGVRMGFVRYFRQSHA